MLDNKSFWENKNVYLYKKLLQNIFMEKLTFLIIMALYLDGFGQVSKDSSIIDNSFYIKQKPQKEYIGIFKNSIPYEGFFKIGRKEPFWVDYYEKGVKKYQYSQDYLKNLDKNYETHKLDIQSTYENGEIVDGESYKNIRKGFSTQKRAKGKLESFMVDLFEVHYFNRITFKKSNNTILITNLEDKNALVKMYFKDKNLVIELFNDNKIRYQIEKIDYILEKLPANSTISCTKIDDVVHCGASKSFLKEIGLSGDLKISQKLITNLIIPQKNNIEEVFEYMATFFEQEDSIYKIYMHDEQPKMLYMAHLTTNDKGQIIDGVAWIEQKTLKKSFFDEYKQGKKVKTEEKDLQDFQAIFRKYLENRY